MVERRDCLADRRVVFAGFQAESALADGGKIIESGSDCVIRSASPRRTNPASAKTIAS